MRNTYNSVTSFEAGEADDDFLHGYAEQGAGTEGQHLTTQ